MKITTKHSTSSLGQPVILSDHGKLMNHVAGIKALRAKLGLTVHELATRCGVSARTVEGWEQGRLPSTPALMILARLL